MKLLNLNSQAKKELMSIRGKRENTEAVLAKITATNSKHYSLIREFLPDKRNQIK
jgi:hypothetical protein